jgi:hypothetical protein
VVEHTDQERVASAHTRSRCLAQKRLVQRYYEMDEAGCGDESVLAVVPVVERNRPHVYAPIQARSRE